MLLQHLTMPEHLLEDVKKRQLNLHLETRLVDDLLDATRIARGTLNLRFDHVDLLESIWPAFSIGQPEIDEKAQRLERALNATCSPLLLERLAASDWLFPKPSSKRTAAASGPPAPIATKARESALCSL